MSAGPIGSPDWMKGTGAFTPSRAFCQTVTMEIFWTAEGDDNGFRDWEGELRGAVIGAEPPAWPGAAVVSDVEELKPEPRA